MLINAGENVNALGGRHGNALQAASRVEGAEVIDPEIQVI